MHTQLRGLTKVCTRGCYSNLDQQKSGLYTTPPIFHYYSIMHIIVGLLLFPSTILGREGERERERGREGGRERERDRERGRERGGREGGRRGERKIMCYQEKDE